MHSIRIALTLLFVALTSGCAQLQRATFGMEASSEVVVTVTGKQSFVTVENDGPGAVDVEFESRPQGDAPIRHVMGGTATGASIICPSRIIFRTGADAGAEVRVLARNASGIGVDSSPAAGD